MGLALTFVDDRTLLSRQLQQGMRRTFGSLVFDTVVHTAVALAEAPRHPCHGVRARPGVRSDFADDEYVIYDTAQQRLEYLVEFAA